MVIGDTLVQKAIGCTCEVCKEILKVALAVDKGVVPLGKPTRADLAKFKDGGRILVKFATWCTTCGVAIPVGATALQLRDRGIWHEGCFDGQ